MPIEPSIILGARQVAIPNPQEAEATALELQGKRLIIGEKARELKNQAAVRSILARYGGDLEKARPELYRVDPELGLKVDASLLSQRTHALDFQKAQSEFHAQQVESLGRLAETVDDDLSLQSFRQSAKAMGIPEADQIPPVWNEHTKLVLQGIRQAAVPVVEQEREKVRIANEKRQELIAAETERKNQANEARQQATEARQHELAMAQIANIAEDNKRQAAAAAETARHNRADEATAAAREHREGAQNQPLDLTGAGLDVAAMNYMKTGQLPPLGMGDKTTRKSIINRAAELGAGTGEPSRTSLDLASNRAGFASDEASLKKLQTSRDAIAAFENTALKNIDIFLNTAGKVVDTGSPLANRAARALTGTVLGSPDQAAYDAARQVALNEVAKIVSNPNLSGQLSDTARKEIEAFNPNSATLAQSVAVMRILKQDMANRASAYDSQIREIKGRISGKPAAPNAADPLGIR